MQDARLSRAQGCLLGQLAGDSLGSLVEFKTASEIAESYPNGVRDLADGGCWNTIAGQPTDDSEMALALARSILNEGTYNPEAALEAYRAWQLSDPFDCGRTVFVGLLGQPNSRSQANGALMRISPLGISGSGFELEKVGEWARMDAALTHPHPICQEANALIAMAIAHAIRSGCDANALYLQIKAWGEQAQVPESLRERIALAGESVPEDYQHQQGWVLTAFHNALWQLLHSDSLEGALVDTISRGGDTDTNAAICGALIGAIQGREAVPDRWIEAILNCRPAKGSSEVVHPRPEAYWPVDALEVSSKLLVLGISSSA